MWRTLFHMLAFSMGAIWRNQAKTSISLPEKPQKWLSLIIVKGVIGHVVLYSVVLIFGSVAKIIFEGALRVYVSEIKPRVQKPGVKSGSVGTVHMRRAALYFVELAQDITAGLTIANVVPRIFDILAI